MNTSIMVFSVILVIPSLALIIFILLRFFCIFCIPFLQKRCCYNNVISEDSYNNLLDSSIL